MDRVGDLHDWCDYWQGHRSVKLRRLSCTIGDHTTQTSLSTA